MNGMAQLLAQARSLPLFGSHKAGGIVATEPGKLGPPELPQNVSDAEAEQALAVLVRRLRVAELRVDYVQQCITAFEEQARKLLDGDPFRDAMLSAMSTMRKLIDKAEADVK